MKEITIKNTQQFGSLLKIFHSYGHSGSHKVNMDMTDKRKLMYFVEVNSMKTYIKSGEAI